MAVDTPEFKEVLRVLLDKAAKWYTIGLSLDMSPGELDTIKADCSGAEECLTKAIRKWHSNADPRPTWRALIDALKTRAVSESVLARQLEEKYFPNETISTLGSECKASVEVARQSLIKIKQSFAALLKNVAVKFKSKQDLDLEVFRFFIVNLFPPGECIPAQSSNVITIFEAVSRNGLWSYWHYTPVEKIVNEYAPEDDEMKEWLVSYRSELCGYKATTKIADAIEVYGDNIEEFEEGDRNMSLASSHDRNSLRKLSVKLKTPVTGKTLEYIDKLWLSLAECFLLPSLTALLDNIKRGCIEVSWLIPPHFESQIHDNLQKSISCLQANNVVEVFIDNEGIYNRAQEDELKQERFRRTGVPSKATSLEVSDLHSVTTVKMLRRELDKEGADPNDSFLLHTILKKRYKSERKRRKLLLAALTYSKVDVNLRDVSGNTALHNAVEEHDLECVKILIAFGANVNAYDQRRRTPLDLLCADRSDMEGRFRAPPTQQFTPTLLRQHLKKQASLFDSTSRSASREEVVQLLKMSGALSAELVDRMALPPDVQPFPLVHVALDAKQRSQALRWVSQLTTQYSDLEHNIRERLRRTSQAALERTLSTDEAVPLALQLNEMEKFKRAGSRILCLDGGGMRGLIQLEVLSQLEKKTGRKITELFDWIIGTSTGGIIALGLVYAKKSTAQLRQLYFRMKDEIFGKARYGGMSFNTQGLERLLKEEFTETKCMDDESYPRVLISAVKKEHINLKLCFFNNCFGDDYCKDQPVWKVARYTSAAPVLFGESDDYVDGGMLANNPSESGLTKIQDFHRSRGEKLPISLVVSVGCGKYPRKELGSVDVFSGAAAWLDVRNVRDRTTNFMSLLTYALVEPSIADNNCRSRCEEQDVSYFRLNPRLEQVIGSGETDMQVLVSMIIQTNKEMNERREMADLVLCLHSLSEAARKMHAHINGEESDTDTSTLGGSKSNSLD